MSSKRLHQDGKDPRLHGLIVQDFMRRKTVSTVIDNREDGAAVYPGSRESAPGSRLALSLRLETVGERHNSAQLL
jgi:hypothetical protein